MLPSISVLLSPSVSGTPPRGTTLYQLVYGDILVLFTGLKWGIDFGPLKLTGAKI